MCWPKRDRLERHSLRSHPRIGQRRRRVSTGFGRPAACGGSTGGRMRPPAGRCMHRPGPGHMWPGPVGTCADGDPAHVRGRGPATCGRASPGACARALPTVYAATVTSIASAGGGGRRCPGCRIWASSCRPSIRRGPGREKYAEASTAKMRRAPTAASSRTYARASACARGAFARATSAAPRSRRPVARASVSTSRSVSCSVCGSSDHRRARGHALGQLAHLAVGDGCRRQPTANRPNNRTDPSCATHGRHVVCRPWRHSNV
jgi:hypothetical protein